MIVLNIKTNYKNAYNSHSHIIINAKNKNPKEQLN
jgi:hypothetical protein